MTNADRTLTRLATAFLCTLALCSATTAGEPLGQDITLQVAGPQQDYGVPSRDDVVRAQAEMLAAARQLDGYLARAGDQWPGLEETLQWAGTRAALETLDTADAETLDALLRACRANVPGMARPEVVRFREALGTFIRTIRGRRAGEHEQEAIHSHLLELKAAAARYAQDRSAASRRRLLEHVAWLHERGLASETIAVLRQQDDRPNLYVQVGQEFLTASLGGPVREDTPVRDVILDTDIFGSGVVTGMVDVRPVPDPQQAVLEFVFHGQVDSKTVGYNGPVQLHSVSQTQVTARQRITIAEQGLQLGTTAAQATNASQLQAICTRARGGVGRLVRRVARRMHDKSHARADCIAARHAERDFRSRVKDDAEESLLPANQSFLDEFRMPLIRLDQYPQLLRFATDDRHLSVVMRQARDSQLAAPDAAPAVADADIAIRLHETFANNFAGGLLAGTTVSDEEVKQQINELFAVRVAETGNRSDRPVLITFAQRDPIELAVADNRVTVTVRGQRFQQGNSIYPAMNVSVCYRIESTPSGTRAVLADEPVIVPPRLADGAAGDISFREIGVRRLLRNLLDRDLQKEIDLQPFDLEVSADKKVKMRVESLAATNGWIACDLGVVETED